MTDQAQHYRHSDGLEADVCLLLGQPHPLYRWPQSLLQRPPIRTRRPLGSKAETPLSSVSFTLSLVIGFSV